MLLKYREGGHVFSCWCVPLHNSHLWQPNVHIIGSVSFQLFCAYPSFFWFQKKTKKISVSLPVSSPYVAPALPMINGGFGIRNPLVLGHHWWSKRQAFVISNWGYRPWHTVIFTPMNLRSAHTCLVLKQRQRCFPLGWHSMTNKQSFGHCSSDDWFGSCHNTGSQPIP